MDIKKDRLLIVFLSVGIMIAAMLPLFLNTGWVSLAIEILIMSIAACAYNLMMGYAGMVSFGPAGQYALGAYGTGVLIVRAGVPFVLAMVAGPVMAALLSIVIGWFSVRRTEVYFSLLTLAFAQIIYTIIQKWYGFTGGDDGLVGIPVPKFLVDINGFYYFALVFAGICLFAMWKIVESPFGKVIQGIRENPRRAEFIGINVKKYQLICFVISSFFIGASGSLYAVFNRSIFPANIDVLKSTDIIVVTLLGGMDKFLGPLLGSGVYILLNKLIANYTHYWALVLGIIIVLLVLYARQGIAGFIPEGFLAFNKKGENK